MNRARILLIDDDRLIRNVMGRVLQPDHELTLLQSASAALALVQDGARFDLILCDLMVRGLSGVDFLTALELVCPLQARRLVFMTGGATTAAAARALAQAVNTALLKPFSVQDLLDTVERVGRAA
jgi:CheY-like chemotaxis protein